MAELVTDSSKLPAHTTVDVFADAGKGSESATMSDMIIPFILCAQKLSPQLNKRESVHIEGLEEGDFFNTATEQFWKGETGFIFVPALYQREYNEWIPRADGGGFAGKHGPEIEKKVVREERNGRFGLYLPNGNTIAITGVWYGLILDKDSTIQAVLSLSSTQLKKSQKLMSQLKELALDRPDGKGKFNPPLWYSRVRVSSVPESNDQGSWMGWKFTLEGSTLDDKQNGEFIYMMAKHLGEAVTKGTAKAAAQPVADGHAGVDDEIPF